MLLRATFNGRTEKAGYNGSMTPILRASTLPTILATILSLGAPQGAFADARCDWQGYAWQTIDVADCRPADAVLACPLFHEKWDWKRNQWVDIAIIIDPAEGQIHLRQQLIDNDSYDDDDVCVTALVVDAAGKNIVAHHQNWPMKHGDAVQQDFTYSSTRLSDAVEIHIGSKQCRQGSTQDDDLYAVVLAGIAP
jgi:hypothetical protein